MLLLDRSLAGKPSVNTRGVRRLRRGGIRELGTHVDVHVAAVRETGEVAGLGEVGAVLGEVCGSRGKGKRSVDVAELRFPREK